MESDDNFGINPAELDSIRRRAYQQHIDDALTLQGLGVADEAATGAALSHVEAQRVWDHALSRGFTTADTFPRRNDDPDGDNDPHPVHWGHTRGWDYRHSINSPFVEISSPGEWNPQGITRVDPDHKTSPWGSSQDEWPTFGPDHVRQKVEEWDDDEGDDYRRQYGL